MKAQYVFLFLFTVLTLLNAHPTTTFVDCNLTSKRNPSAGVLTQRATIMGGVSVKKATADLGELISVGTSGWFQFTIASAPGEFLLHTSSGTLRIDSASQSETTLGSCENWVGIVYQGNIGDKIGYLPRTSSSILTVARGTGPGGVWEYEQVSHLDVVGAPTLAPTASSTNTSAPTIHQTSTPSTGVTTAPTHHQTTAPLTPAPTKQLTSAPTPTLENAGGRDETDKIYTKDTVFRIVIAALTLLYANFIWVTIEPLKLLGYHH